jgi:hypothetical protein
MDFETIFYFLAETIPLGHYTIGISLVHVYTVAARLRESIAVERVIFSELSQST